MFADEIITKKTAMLLFLLAFMNGSAAQLDGESSLSNDMSSLATLHSLVDDVEENSAEGFSLDTDVEHAQGKKICTPNLVNLFLGSEMRKVQQLQQLRRKCIRLKSRSSKFKCRRNNQSKFKKLIKLKKSIRRQRKAFQDILRSTFPKSANPSQPCCHCKRASVKRFGRLMNTFMVLGIRKSLPLLGMNERKTVTRKFRAIKNCLIKKCFPAESPSRKNLIKRKKLKKSGSSTPSQWEWKKKAPGRWEWKKKANRNQNDVNIDSNANATETRHEAAGATLDEFLDTSDGWGGGAAC